jgi:hypothetical protein
MTYAVYCSSLLAQFHSLSGIKNPDEVRWRWAIKATEIRPTQDTAEPKAVLAPGSRVFPEFANGPVPGFSYSARTAINVVNMTNSPVDVLVEFFDKSGQRLSVGLEDPNNLGALGGHFPGVTGTVKPYAAAGMRTYPLNEPYSEGWARITSNPANTLAPTATVALINPGMPQFEVAIPLCDRFEQNVFLPFLNTDIYSRLLVLLTTRPHQRRLLQSLEAISTDRNCAGVVF